MALDDLLTTLERRKVTPVTPGNPGEVTENPAPLLAVTPVTPVTPKNDKGRNDSPRPATLPTLAARQTRVEVTVTNHVLSDGQRVEFRASVPVASLPAMERAGIVRFKLDMADPEDVAEFIAERAAIMEFDGGMPRAEAGREAARRAAVKYGLSDLYGDPPRPGGGYAIGAEGDTAESLLADLRERYGGRLVSAVAEMPSGPSGGDFPPGIHRETRANEPGHSDMAIPTTAKHMPAVSICNGLRMPGGSAPEHQLFTHRETRSSGAGRTGFSPNSPAKPVPDFGPGSEGVTHDAR